MNIVEIIKKAPKDHVYWSPLLGECRVICTGDDDYPIVLENEFGLLHIAEDGHYYKNMPNSECIFFPSKDNRDWAAFERELDGKAEAEKKSLSIPESESFNRSIEMVSVPNKPMMAAVICAGLIARGYKDKGMVLTNAVKYANIILEHTKEKSHDKGTD